jgi:hypothetical protein
MCRNQILLQVAAILLLVLLQFLLVNNFLKVDTDDINPLVDNGAYCVRVAKICIRGQGCDDCVVTLVQGSNMWHMMLSWQSNCKHVTDYVNVVPDVACKPGYFNNYKYTSDCFDTQFSCTSSGDATTQFWFVHSM